MRGRERSVSSDGFLTPRLGRDGSDWVLVLERVMEHPPEEVWAALTRAAEIAKWGPFTADRDLTFQGPLRLMPINMPDASEAEGNVLEVREPHVLVYQWGTDVLRWELRRDGERTALVVRHRFANRGDAPSYAAGWHLCLDGLSGTLDGREMPSMVGLNAMHYGWRDLHARYAAEIGADPK